MNKESPMTCRHSPGDPNCSSNQPRVVYRDPPGTPDKTRYEVLDAAQVETFLVLKVKYPNCEKCKFEGIKIMVFQDVTTIDALKWKEIDPHFRDPLQKWNHRAAPSPIARFPGNDDGWKDAIAYAQRKAGCRTT
jgi:hypothetical protein